MSVYITPQDELHVEHEGIALTCPQCQPLTHITATATPRFDDLSRRKPKQVGVVFRCDACGEPIFLKFNAKAYTALRIELGELHRDRTGAREISAHVLARGCRRAVPRGSELILRGLLHFLR